MTCSIEFLEIELFDHLIVCKKWPMFNSIIDETLQYLEQFNSMLIARGVMVIVVGNGHGDTSSNPGRYWLHFTLH